MLNAGVAGEITNEHVSQLVGSLQLRPGIAERLAVPLAWRDRFSKLNPLSKRLLGELRARFSNAIRFEQNDFVGYRAPIDIEAWVVEHAPKAPPVDRDIWIRRFVVCLLKDTETKALIKGLVASAQIWTSSDKPRRQTKEPAEGAFVRGLAQSLGSATISTGKLDLALSGIKVLEDQFQDMLSRELAAQRQIRTQQDSITHYADQVSKLEEDIAQVREESNQRSAQISELTLALTNAQEKYRLLDQHWRGVSEQELAKQSGSFREKVSRELHEALLALDRDNPNLDMALRRLRRIEEILKAN